MHDHQGSVTFRLVEDVLAFYAVKSEGVELSWRAGRMLRAPTVFEDVVRTICSLLRTAVSGSGLARRAPSPA